LFFAIYNLVQIMNKKCTLCHNGSQAGQSPDLSKDGSYLALTSGGFVDIDDPESSSIIQKLENEADHGGAGSTPVDIAKILAWITAGAPND
jgi:GH15 family glucan-1,4-alpha-glucosidase